MAILFHILVILYSFSFEISLAPKVNSELALQLSLYFPTVNYIRNLE